MTGGSLLLWVVASPFPKQVKTPINNIRVFVAVNIKGGVGLIKIKYKASIDAAIQYARFPFAFFILHPIIVIDKAYPKVFYSKSKRITELFKGNPGRN